MPDLPAHIEDALTDLESPFATLTEKGEADTRLRAILKRAREAVEREPLVADGDGYRCVLCGGTNRADASPNIPAHYPDCPHRKLKEAMSDGA